MAVKKLIQDQPKFGDLSQYNFDDSTGNYDYENSAGLPKNPDKFENKDLFTKSAGNELNNAIIERNLKTEGISQIKINTLRINNNDVNRDCKSNEVKCFMFSQKYADADNKTYSGISSILARDIPDDDGGDEADRFYKKTDSHIDEGKDFGTIIENQILIQNLKNDSIELEAFSNNTPEYNANYMLPLSEEDTNISGQFNTSIIDESILNPIYIVIYMKGNSDNNWGADAERKKKFTIFRINNLELFNYDNSGNAIAKSTTFQYRQGQGITQGEWTKYSVENSGDLKPAWTVGEFELQIDTNLSSPNDWDFGTTTDDDGNQIINYNDVLPGDPDVDTPDEKLYEQYFLDVQPPYVFNRNEIKLVDLLNLSPSRQLNNIDQAGNNKTNLFPDYFPQTTINVVNQNNQPQDLDLQSYYYDTMSSIKGSAPATVSIFFNIINPDDETLMPDQNFYYFIIDWDDKDDTIKTLQDWEDNRPTNLDDLIQLQQENLYIMYSAKSVEQTLTLDTSYPTPNPYELFPDSLGFEQQGNMPPFLQATISTATQACIELGHSGQNNVEADASSTPPGTVYWDDGNQQWDTIPIPNAYITNLDCLRSTQFYTENPSLIRKSYTTPGIKTIKSIVFSYDDMTNQVGRWKLVTSRFFLDIPINQYPDFAEVGGSDYTTIPWPYTTPVIGGVDNDSKYKKSVQDTLSGGKILDTELIDERFLVNDLENDELGKSVKDMDLEQIRYFNKSYDINELLNIVPDPTVNPIYLEENYLSSLLFPQYFEEFDVSENGELTSEDSDIWNNDYGRPDIANQIMEYISDFEEWNNLPEQGFVGTVRLKDSNTNPGRFYAAQYWSGALGDCPFVTHNEDGTFSGWAALYHTQQGNFDNISDAYDNDDIFDHVTDDLEFPPPPPYFDAVDAADIYFPEHCSDRSCIVERHPDCDGSHSFGTYKTYNVIVPKPPIEDILPPSILDLSEDDDSPLDIDFSQYFNDLYFVTVTVEPYNSEYWDGDVNKFPMESSVGQIFITENQDKDLVQNCKLELNTGQLSGKSIYDSSGNSNKGLLIGDYKVKKVRKGEPMRRDSFIKVPKKTGNKDGAL